uniref:Uncharacterized protein n=1 Tax=Micrurus lemniscatus lemniscatus TaxID=129467 RepID=A0A2D4IZK0_MICLE
MYFILFLFSTLFPRDLESHLSHDHVLAFLNVLALSLDDSVKKVKILNMAPMCGQTMDEVLQHPFADLRAQLIIVQKDVLHCLCLQELTRKEFKKQLSSLICT